MQLETDKTDDAYRCRSTKIQEKRQGIHHRKLPKALRAAKRSMAAQNTKIKKAATKTPTLTGSPGSGLTNPTSGKTLPTPTAVEVRSSAFATSFVCSLYISRCRSL
jgi:hypothetical protein